MADVVLVVDDNPDTIDLFRIVLPKRGFAIATAKDGFEALASARAVRPGVVLLDMHIPRIPGLEVARLLKADPATQDIAIIAHSAFAADDDRRRAYESGCDGFVAKPASISTVVGEIARQMRRRVLGSGAH